MREYSDEQLVALTLNASDDAYAEIVRRYKNRAFGIAYEITGEYHAAEDITQETFIDAFFSLSTLRSPTLLGAWIAGIAKRKARHFACRRQRYDDIETLVSVGTFDTSPEQNLVRQENIRAVRAALAHLSTKNEQVARMFYLEELTVAQIAHRLALPIGTVKSRLHDARIKLRKELSEMKETIPNLPPEFEAELKKKIDDLRIYYRVHGHSYDGFDRLLAEARTMADRLPEGAEKKTALAELVLREYYAGNEDNKEKRQAAFDAAQSAQSAEHLCRLYVDEILGLHDYEKWIERIDGELIPLMERMGAEHGKGIFLFWRGSANYRLCRLEQAKEDLAQAARLIPPQDIYHACALSGVRGLELSGQYCESPFDGVSVTAESYRQIGSRRWFVSQPGFSSNNSTWRYRKLDCIYYHASGAAVFFDTSMHPGDTIATGDGVLRVIAFDESVTVAAGCFERCMHMNYTEDDYSAHIWYAHGVGLIKAVFTGYADETYELSEYEIRGGDGYFPMCEGNRWRYVKPDLPEYLWHRVEYEIDCVDGDTAHLIVVNICGYKKEHETLCEHDSAYYIGKCEKLCNDWKTVEAIDALRAAVRANTTQTDVHIALAGIGYLERFYAYQEKGYRFCPSSMNDSTLVVSDDRVKFGEGEYGSFGPYQWGSRFEENRIFGVKPLRFLQALLGRVYDAKWIPGYTEEARWRSDKNVRLCVSDGGTVTTAAGTFEGCIKLTLTCEPEDGTKDYFADDFRHVVCGTKEYFFAPGVGIVRFDCTWGDQLTSRADLVRYAAPGAQGGYFPVCIGNEWEYDEVNLTAEGYRAKRIMRVECGTGGKYLLTDAQEFLYLGTTQEYEDFKASLR